MTDKKSTTKKSRSVLKGVVRGEQMGARRAVIEELFNDMYEDRRNIYLMNFIRGIFFGLGSVLGGTIVIAFIVWILSFFVQIPFIGPSLQEAQDQIRSSRDH
jgi:hypothetical protein